MTPRDENETELILDGAPAVGRVLSGRPFEMSTLAVVEEILRETAMPLSVKEIVERAGSRLPSKSKTPDTVVARDLSMDIKKKGDTSLFVRTSPGRYTLRELASRIQSGDGNGAALPRESTSVLASLRSGERAAPLPAAPRKPPVAPPQAVGEREASR
jgi:hypothetical protein